MTTYPAPTKVLSANYEVAGTQFAIADEDEDFLEPEDIYRLARAVEEHQHDNDRGLPVRRIETASAPAAPGHVQVLGDELRWWADTSDQIRTALTREGNQIIDGVMRFNQPLLMQAQLIVPPAPGAGLSYLYPKPDGRLYIRSGSGPEQGVGSPPTWNLPALGWNTDQVPGTNPELVRMNYTSPTWVLAYDPAGNAPGEAAHTRVRVPATYIPGLAVSIAVAWSAPSGVAGQQVTWRYYFARSGVGDALTPGWAVTPELTGTYVGSVGNCYQVVTGTTTVPGLLPGDSLFVGLVRLNGGTLTGDAHMIDGSVTFA